MPSLYHRTAYAVRARVEKDEPGGIERDLEEVDMMLQVRATGATVHLFAQVRAVIRMTIERLREIREKIRGISDEI